MHFTLERPENILERMMSSFFQLHRHYQELVSILKLRGYQARQERPSLEARLKDFPTFVAFVHWSEVILRLDEALPLFITKIEEQQMLRKHLFNFETFQPTFYKYRETPYPLNGAPRPVNMEEWFHMSLTMFFKWRENIRRSLSAKESLKEIFVRQGQSENDPNALLLLSFAEGETEKYGREVFAHLIRDAVNYKSVQPNVLNYSQQIIVTDKPLTSEALEDLARFSSIRFTIFYESELNYDPTKHVFSPEYTLVSRKDLPLKLSKLAPISRQELVIRRLGGQIKDVVMIVNRDLLGQAIASTLTYRVVTE